MDYHSWHLVCQSVLPLYWHVKNLQKLYDCLKKEKSENRYVTLCCSYRICLIKMKLEIFHWQTMESSHSTIIVWRGTFLFYFQMYDVPIRRLATQVIDKSTTSHIRAIGTLPLMPLPHPRMGSPSLLKAGLKLKSSAICRERTHISSTVLRSAWSNLRKFKKNSK